MRLSPEHEEELRKLKELQALYAEHAAIKDQQIQHGGSPRPDSRDSASSDSMFLPGLYAPSGFDVLQILFQIQRRPNPTYPLGNIDSGVALVLCDSSRPHCPIVYCSEPFQRLTGYSQSEIIGKNCRFLQHPFNPNTFDYLGTAPTMKGIQNPKNDPNAMAKLTIRTALERGLESQVALINYRKNGEQFLNVLTTVPLRFTTMDGEEKDYIVGFQAQAPPMFRHRSA